MPITSHILLRNICAAHFSQLVFNFRDNQQRHWNTSCVVVPEYVTRFVLIKTHVALWCMSHYFTA